MGHGVIPQIATMPTMNQSYVNEANDYVARSFAIRDGRTAHDLSGEKLPQDSLSAIDLLVEASSVAIPSRNLVTQNVEDEQILSKEKDLYREGGFDEVVKETNEFEFEYDDNDDDETTAGDTDADDINELIEEQREKQDQRTKE